MAVHYQSWTDGRNAHLSACGCALSATRTTSDVHEVTCRRCLSSAAYRNASAGQEVLCLRLRPKGDDSIGPPFGFELSEKE